MPAPPLAPAVTVAAGERVGERGRRPVFFSSPAYPSGTDRGGGSAAFGRDHFPRAPYLYPRPTRKQGGTAVATPSSPPPPLPFQKAMQRMRAAWRALLGSAAAAAATHLATRVPWPAAAPVAHGGMFWTAAIADGNLLIPPVCTIVAEAGAAAAAAAAAAVAVVVTTPPAVASGTTRRCGGDCRLVRK